MQAVLSFAPAAGICRIGLALVLGWAPWIRSNLAQEVVIADPGLNAAVRRALGKLTGPLTAPELLSITNLNADGAFVQNLEGLGAARNLVRLDLQNNFITNATIPAELTALTWLDLHASHLTELALPAGLTNLSMLNAGGNSLASFVLPADVANLTTLDLEFNQLTNVVLPGGLTNLTRLDLFNNRLTDLTIPPDYSQLKELFAFANQLTNVRLPAGLSQLAYLDLHNNQLRTLTIPEGLIGLARLELGGNRLVTVSLPAGLTNLARLGLCCNQLTELLLPGGLTSLAELDLSQNPLTRLTLPADLTALTRLMMSGDSLRDFSGSSSLANAVVQIGFDASSKVTLPAGLTNITRVDLTGSQLTDLSGITNLTRLSQLVLNLPGNPSTSLIWPSGLTNLSYLQINQSQLNDFSFLTLVPTLRTLSLDVNQLTSLTLPPTLLDLTALDLRGSQLTDYSFLDRFPAVRTLSLSLDQATNLVLPSGLKNLTQLQIRGNALSDLVLPEDLTSLASLSVAGTRLVNLSLPAGLGNLVEIDFSRNQLASFVLPAGLTNLTTLDLSFNQLTNLAGAADLSGLSVLTLSWNQLSSVTVPSEAQQLSHLALDQNPLQFLALPEPLATSKLADEVAALQSQGVTVLPYPTTLFPPLTDVRACPEPEFAAAQSSPVGPYPRSLAFADLNNDGIPDLAVANAGCASCSSQGWVSIWLGDGNGQYRTTVPLSGSADGRLPTPGQHRPGVGPVSISVGDFDADGNADLVVANEGSFVAGTLMNSSVSILRGNGDGTMQNVVNYGVGAASMGTTVADFNGDQIPDVAVANRGSTEQSFADGSVVIMLGEPDGNFQDGIRTELQFGFGLGSPSLGQPLAAGDLNGDGAVDLVALRHEFGLVSVLLGQGDGTFVVPVDLEMGRGQLPASLLLSDLNGDSQLDLVVANSDTSGTVGDFNTVSVLLGQGDGTFQAPVEYLTSAWSGFLGSVYLATGDFNNDTKPDLAVANGDGGNVSILLGTGDGAFQPAVNYEVGPAAYVLAVSDVNHDAKADLVTGTASRLGVLFGKGDGTFPAAVKFAPGQGPVSAKAADFNRDGKLDLVVANSGRGTGSSTNGQISILLGRGNGTFLPPTQYGAAPGPGSVAVGDLNGDGQADLAVANYVPDYRSGQTNNGSISTFIGIGNGRFRAAASYPSVLWPASAKLSDLNADGKLDLAVANNGSYDFANGRFTNGSVAIFFGNGDGTLQPPVNYPVECGTTVPGADLLAVADLNRDGKPDLIVGRRAEAPLASGLSVLLNRGDGSFQPGVQLDIGRNGFPSSVAASDFNGDAQPDIAVVSGEGLAVLIGNGDGTFQSPAKLDVNVVFGTITAADFDSDFHPDLAVLGDARGLSLLFADGQGAFDRIRSYEVAAGPCCVNVASLVPGDFNGDGRLDLAVADGVNVAVHLNECNELRPEIRAVAASGSVKISWPVGDFALESTDALGPINWQLVSGPISTNNNRLEITVPAAQSQRFFRLSKP